MSVYYRNLFYEHWNKDKVSPNHVKFPNTVSIEGAVQALAKIDDSDFRAYPPKAFLDDTMNIQPMNIYNRFRHKMCYIYVYGCIRHTDFIQYPYVDSRKYDGHNGVGAMQQVADSLK
jgi:hypothetical protein